MALALLLTGFLLGIRHSLDADHLAAVATLATRSKGTADSLRQGLAWGLGHTAALLVFGSLVVWVDGVVPAELARWLEAAVGLLLIVLGAEVLWRLLRDRVHFHSHRHADGETHFHAHSHAGQPGPHGRDEHGHRHTRRIPLRALYIGVMHGMAGSAALILLTLQSVQSPWVGMLYILLFGLGSMLGMGLLSVVIAIPLRRSARGLTWVHGSLTGVVGAVSIVVGVLLLGTP